MEALQEFISKRVVTLIRWDFNDLVIDWHARSCSVIGLFSNNLLEFTEMVQLFQGTTLPTRFGIGTSPSILDFVFFSVPDAFSQVSRLLPIGLSDHAVVKLILNWRTSTSNEPFRHRRWYYYRLKTVKLTALEEGLNWSETTRQNGLI